MMLTDLDTAKYRLSRVAREHDSQTFVVSVEDMYDGEFYKIAFQRGFHTYTYEVEGERFQEWFEDEDHPHPDMVHVVSIAVDELTS